MLIFVPNFNCALSLVEPAISSLTPESPAGHLRAPNLAEEQTPSGQETLKTRSYQPSPVQWMFRRRPTKSQRQ